MSLLLIDGDIVAHRVAWTCERTKYLVSRPDNLVAGDGNGGHELFDDAKTAKQYADEGQGYLVWSRKEIEPEEKAITVCEQVMRDITARYDLEPRTFLTPSVGNFRDKVATRAKYKGNRDSAPRPTHLKAVREYLTRKWHATLAEGQEADDCIGIYATSNPGSVIVSIDKDLRQIPATHYNWVDKEEIVIDKKTGDLNFFVQVLTGDKTDNVPGIAGVGPVTAAKILEGAQSRKECWARIEARYKEEYGDDGLKHAIETANLVWILREPGQYFVCP